jgi:hypothetical protein
MYTVTYTDADNGMAHLVTFIHSFTVACFAAEFAAAGQYAASI